MAPNFKLLQSKWYGKIAKKGFKDIEGPSGMLNEYSGSHYHEEFSQQVGSKTPNSSKVVKELQAEYYRLATAFLNTKRFKKIEPLLQKMVWRLHVNGASTREIGTKLGVSTMSVQRRIDKTKVVFLKWIDER